MTTAGGSLRLGRQEIHLSFLKLFSLVVRISWFTYCLHIYCTNNFFPRLFHSKYKASHRHSARTGTSLVLRWILFLTPSPPDTLDRDPRYPTPKGHLSIILRDGKISLCFQNMLCLLSVTVQMQKIPIDLSNPTGQKQN